mgnify:CR=1 FL=1
MRHFDVDFRDKNGERYQLSKRIAELTEALMANYFRLRYGGPGRRMVSGWKIYL